MIKLILLVKRKGKELKAPRHASAAATRDGNLLSRDGNLPYVTANCLIPDTGNSSFVVALYIQILLDCYNKYGSSLLTIAIAI